MKKADVYKICKTCDTVLAWAGMFETQARKKLWDKFSRGREWLAFFQLSLKIRLRYNANKLRDSESKMAISPARAIYTCPHKC